MDINKILEQINLQSEMVAIGTIVMAVGLIFVLNRKRLMAAFREWRIQRSLNQIGSEQIRNLVCADGLEGYYHIDRLALTRDAILLISYKPYGGNIYCAEKISQWTQVVGQKSFKFENPLFELENQLTALRLLTGNVPMQGYLIFNNRALFPKGHPTNVMRPDDIPTSLLAGQQDHISAEIQAGWERLKLHQKESSGEPGISVKT